MADQWLSIVEYARYYSISDMTVRRRIKTGKLRAVLKDGKYYIPLGQDEPAALGYPAQPPVVSEREAYDNSWSSYEPASDRMQRHQRPAPQVQPEFGHERGRPDHRERRKRHFEKAPFVQKSYLEVKAKQPVAAANFSPPASGHIPSTIKDSLVRQDMVMLESKALLSFCESVLDRLNDSEKRIEGDFKNKVASLEAKTKSLEAQLNAKEVKVNELQQQVEDLQLLVKIIEKQK